MLFRSGFLMFGIRHLSGSTTAAGISVIIGFIAWGFLEYVLHRWLLHGRPSMARRGHARHHADDTALISTPALVVMAAACATWATLSVVFPTDVACLLVFGLYAGYNHYALLHHLSIVGAQASRAWQDSNGSIASTTVQLWPFCRGALTRVPRTCPSLVDIVEEPLATV